MAEGSRVPWNGRAAVALINQRLDGMGESLDELKGLVKELTAVVVALDKKELTCQATVQTRVARAHERLDEQGQDIQALETWQEAAKAVMQRLQYAYGILVFVASVFGVSLIALIWALLTGQAQVIFK